MSKIRVYCPNHGLLKEIEMDCMWVGKPPMPEYEDAFCPKCGAKTRIVRDKKEHLVYSWTAQDEKKEQFRKSFGIESDKNEKVTKTCKDTWDY